MINHKVMSWVFALGAGLFLAFFSYQRITDPEPALQRAREEAAVMTGRDIIGSIVGSGPLEFTDPLDPDRVIGKTYVFPLDDGWQLSGFYRRPDEVSWHPYMMTLDAGNELNSLSIRDADPDLARLAAGDPRLTIKP